MLASIENNDFNRNRDAAVDSSGNHFTRQKVQFVHERLPRIFNVLLLKQLKI